MFTNRFVIAVLLIIFVLRTVQAKTRKKFTNRPPQKQIVRSILLWNSFFGKKEFLDIGEGQEPFIDNECDKAQCYVTSNREWMPVEAFDAILFHAPHPDTYENDFPKSRLPFQKYVFLYRDSPHDYRIKNTLNGVFNITITYRLDSDIVFPYFTIVDAHEKLVAPAFYPKWEHQRMEEELHYTYMTIFSNKSKPVAWFVSRCGTPNKRETYVRRLQNYIEVDIYGRCGNFTCSKHNDSCSEMVRKKYYFYLAFENSNCRDYVSDRIISAMSNDAVPVVYGGADYNRFLPPGSYIDATKLTAKELAALMKRLMHNKSDYALYFWWKDYYKIVKPKSPFCDLCALLHAKRTPPKTYYDFQTWWTGNKGDRVCRNGIKK